MKFGMNTLLWSDDVTGDAYLPLFERLKEMGFDSVEPAVLQTHTAAFTALGKQLDGLGLERTASTALAPEHNLISPDASVRAAGLAQLKRVIDCCHAMGAKILVGPLQAALGVFSGAGPTEQEWAWSVEGLRAAAEHAEQAGVVLATEFLNRFEIYLLNTASDAHRLVQEVDHPHLRMMYDTFHAHIEEKNVEEAIKACAESLVHVHISENDRGTPGQGQVRWQESFAALRRIGYDGCLTIEAFGQSLPAIAAATKIWRRMYETEDQLAADGLAFLKQTWA
ncbi:D-tagatose 3-epimerase [Planctomycetes bacterium Poly30]|uniref:D-tagatose 3-epimerase n=1 Tax=Saltatorellus ferox TaxID=2528018 RepID=A0A518ES76_9BACT|nr:D-tagatose 3-epimerase [Planctomycetes bacterium Poly30]